MTIPVNKVYNQSNKWRNKKLTKLKKKMLEAKRTLERSKIQDLSINQVRHENILGKCNRQVIIEKE